MIESPIILALASALSLGFLSSLHCVGMCGGIMGALTMAVSPQNAGQRAFYVLTYNLGRIITYAVIGALLGGVLATIPSANMALRWVAGLLLIAMGLYLANWWQGLTYLERGGQVIWRRIQPLSKSLLPVNSGLKAFILGGVWGWLPCGLVYSALAFAATQQNAQQAAMVMIAFGLGTLPAVFATGMAAESLRRLAQKTGIRRALGLLIVVFGVWTLWASLPFAHDHSGHGHDAHSHDVHSHGGLHEHLQPMDAHEAKNEHHGEMKDSSTQASEEHPRQSDGADHHHHH